MKPVAITLDLHLHDMHGWRVLTRMKNDLAVRHIPVYVISTDEARDQAGLAGAQHFIAKPLPSRKAVDDIFELMRTQIRNDEQRAVIVLDANESRRLETMQILRDIDGVEVLAAGDLEDAAKVMRGKSVGCVIVPATK